MAFPLTPSTIGDSLRNATAAKSGDVFAPSSDCYNTVIVPALQFSVEVHGKPNAFSVVFEGSADGLFDDTVTLATITQADPAIATIENTYPVYLRARLVSISGGINPAITARIRVITENKAVADIGLPSQTSNSGKFLTTDGSVSSWGTAGGAIQTATVTLTDADIKTLPSVPFEVVPAQGSGKIVVPVTCIVESSFAAGAYTGLDANSYYGLSDANDDRNTSTLGNATAVFANVSPVVAFLIPFQRIDTALGAAVVSGPILTAAPLDNAPAMFYLTNGSALGGGDPANRLKVTLLYYVYTRLP